MDETISVEPTVETGGHIVETEPTLEQPVTPTEPQEPTTPVEPEVELYELPDGRKVDAQTLTKEWKENFYPEYTRKSQELAQVKQTTQVQPETQEEWVPQTYEEIVEKAKQEVFKTFEQQEVEKRQAVEAIETEVATQLTDVKKLEPSINENQLFAHATKYGFRDLRLAYQNMKDMNQIVKNVQQTTAKNIAKRQDPVSVQPGAIGAKPDPRQFSSAAEYFRSINQ